MGDRKERFSYHPSLITYHSSLPHRLRQEILFQLLPLLFRLAAQISRHRLDRDIVVGAESSPEQETRVVLSRLVGNLIHYFGFLFSHFHSPPNFLQMPARGDSCTV